MIISKECLISLELTLETNIRKEIGKFMYNELNSPKYFLLSSFLLQKKKVKIWKFYFDLLPKRFFKLSKFLHWKRIRIFKRKSILNQVLDKKIYMKIDYEKICYYISSFSHEVPEHYIIIICFIVIHIFSLSFSKSSKYIISFDKFYYLIYCLYIYNILKLENN